MHGTVLAPYCNKQNASNVACADGTMPCVSGRIAFIPHAVLQSALTAPHKHIVKRSIPVSERGDDKAARVTQVLIPVQGISIDHAYHESFLQNTQLSVRNLPTQG